MRRPATFRKADLVKAITAARAAGVEVDRVEIGADGKMVVVMREGQERRESNVNEWDNEQ